MLALYLPQETAPLTKEFEGLHRLYKGLVYPYRDPVGFPTQGWGRLLSRNRTLSLATWPARTVEECELWLEEDLRKHCIGVLRMVKVPITSGQLAALTDFSFNLGSAALRDSTLLRRLNEGEYFAAANQFPRWVFAGAVKLPGLVRRRAAERALFLL